MISTFTSSSYVNRVQESWQPGHGVTQLSQTASPTLYFDFLTGTLNPSITFTRTGTGGTFFNSAGVLTSAAADQPRFDYNPSTLAAQGLLIEEARTNLATYSAALNDALGWTPQDGLTVTANAITSPDGTLSAERLASNGISTGFLDKNFAITSGTTYTLSCFFKKHNTSTVTILIYGAQFNSGGANVTGTFNLDTGIATGVNGAASMTAVGNGWYRCVLTKDATTTGSFTQQAVRMASVTGDVYAWGYQIEAGAFPTSYIPTTTTALTRNADVASVNTLSPWYNASEGTLFTQASVITTSYNQGVLVDLGAGGAFGTTEYINWNGTGWTLNPTGAPINVSSTVTTSSPAKIAAGLKVNDSVISANGLIGATDTSCGIVAAPTTLSIGKAGWAFGNFFNGWIQRITYYPRRLSNAELVSITS